MMFSSIRRSGTTVETQSTHCHKCGSHIMWSSNDNEGAVGFSGVLSKLRYHQDNDAACLRNNKIKELLGEEGFDPIHQFVVKEIKIS